MPFTETDIASWTLAVTLAFFSHVALSAWINLVRGGSHGVLSAPSWFPGRQVTGAVYFLPALLLIAFLPASGPLGVLLVAFGAPITMTSIIAVYALPAAVMVASQGPGHGSYMDAGTYGQRDNEWSAPFLDAFSALEETVLRDGVTGEPLLNEKGREIIVDNPLRDFVGGLLKGVVLMALPPAVLWYAWTGEVWAFSYLLAGVAYPVAWFLNNRWWRHLGRIGLTKTTPVYWAELIQGAVFGAMTWVFLAAAIL